MLGAADPEFAGRFDVQLRDDAVIDHHRKTLAARAELREYADQLTLDQAATTELPAGVPAEVLARRRAGPGTAAEATAYRVGDLELDRLSHRVTRAGHEIALQPREFRLLEYLMRHAGQVVTRTMLLEHVWDYHFDPQTNVIDVHVSRLRAKIDRDFEHAMIQTVRGAGYMLRAEGARPA